MRVNTLAQVPKVEAVEEGKPLIDLTAAFCSVCAQRAHREWSCEKGPCGWSGRAGSIDPLRPVGKGVFRVGDEISPERLRFGQVVQGQALCANLFGSDYYRFFTP